MPKSPATAISKLTRNQYIEIIQDTTQAAFPNDEVYNPPRRIRLGGAHFFEPDADLLARDEAYLKSLDVKKSRK